ncbi:AsmA family protein [Rhodovulum sp. PH10]|uniref:AsmA family protein n=1 Tax=Rhodovulum sp. PH10 TaxID=1187851 RepID=UPI00027C2179|nr:AsmA family protein [Rhodovulum sp. PH10]EJW13170.1 AsmA family protein [Rhodovulum sp. PH10]
MTPRKVAALAGGAVVLAGLLVAIHGIPARSLVETAVRQPLADEGLTLEIGGDARLTLWPATLVLERVTLRDEAADAPLVAVDRIEADVSLGALWRGRADVSTLTLTRPVVRTQTLFRRAAREATARSDGDEKAGAPAGIAIDAVRVTDGTIVLQDAGRTAELPVDALRVATVPAPGGRSTLHLDARSGDSALRLTAPADGPARLGQGEAVPIEMTVEAPRLFRSPATLSATVRRTGPVLRAEGVSGMIDQGRLRGTVSVSVASGKPFVDAKLESERLDLSGLIAAVPPAQRTDAAGTAAAAAWSEQKLDLFGLGLVDADLSLVAREVQVDALKIAPATVEATLLSEVLTVTLARAGLYGGQATGTLTLDRAHGAPAVGLKAQFADVGALPFLRDTTGFETLEGRARGSLDVKGAGDSPRGVVASLAGHAEVAISDGAVRGVDLPGMLRSLVDTILSGWQGEAGDRTRFTTFSASFTVENGIARTTDAALAGPSLVASAAGNIDLVDRTLDLRADPRLVIVAAGDDRPEPWGIGVPVVVQGSWAAPRIYADTPNILSDPDGALKGLREALGGSAGIARMIEGFGRALGASGAAGTGETASGGPASDDRHGGTPDATRRPGILADEIMRALKRAPHEAPGAAAAPPVRTRTIRPIDDAAAEPAAEPAPVPSPASPPPARSATRALPQAAGGEAGPAASRDASASASAADDPPPPPRGRPRSGAWREPRPPPEPTIREIEQGAREFFRDLLGR